MVSHVPAEESLFQQSKSDLEKRYLYEYIVDWWCAWGEEFLRS